MSLNIAGDMTFPLEMSSRTRRSSLGCICRVVRFVGGVGASGVPTLPRDAESRSGGRARGQGDAVAYSASAPDDSQPTIGPIGTPLAMRP